MAFFKWDESLSLGVGPIDAQHQKLVGYVNELFEAITNKRSQDVVGRILDDLIGYTVDHFTAEEALFDSHGFPESKKHKDEHARLTERVEELQSDFRGGTAMLDLVVMTFLKDWLERHIKQSDKKYVDFMNKPR